RETHSSLQCTHESWLCLDDVATVIAWCFFVLLLPPPPRSTLFPYTTLFRSRAHPAARDALRPSRALARGSRGAHADRHAGAHARSEEHTSELQSRGHLVCRPLLEKKKRTNPAINRLPHDTKYPPRAAAQRYP